MRGMILVPLLLLGAAAPEAPRQEKNDHGAGIAVIASAVGHEYSLKTLETLLQVGRFRRVVVDWAWITAHWDRTDFRQVNLFVRHLKAAKIDVTAMYRPRFYEREEEKVGVPYQVDADGNPVSHGREICFSSPEARAWGVRWAVEILKKCPAFDEVTIYNPRNFCACATCAEGKKKDRDHPMKMTEAFLSEVRAAMRKVNRKARLGVVYMPTARWYERLKETIDVARPFLFVREDHDFAKDFEGAREALEVSRAAGPGLAKMTWGPGERVTDDKLAAFIGKARENRMPFVFWTFGTTFLEGIYDVDRICRALGIDARRIKPLLKKLGGK